MSTNVTSIKRQDQVGDDPPRADGKQADPLRAELDMAIKMAWKYTTAVSAARSALERGRDLVSEAEAAVEAATAAVGEARASDAKAAARAVKTRGDVVGGGATKQKRRDLEDASDAAEVAREALKTLEADLTDAESKVIWRQNAVIAARAACLAPVVEEIVERIGSARLALAAGRAQLSELLAGVERGAPTFDDVLARMKAGEAIRAPLEALKSRIDQVTLVNVTPEEAAAKEKAVVAMRAFVDRLATDATADPPTIE
jgi:hypothetical protein